MAGAECDWRAPAQRGALIAAASCGALVQVAGDSESVVSVLEFRGNTGSRGAARDLDVVAPRSSTGGLTRRFQPALVRALRIAFRRDRVIARVVPVTAPLVYVVADVVEAESVWGILRDGFGSGLPAPGIVGKRLRRFVAPGKLFLLQAAAGSTFPFGFGGEPEVASGLLRQPFAVMQRFMPRRPCDGLLRMVEVRIAPERRRRGTGRS